MTRVNLIAHEFDHEEVYSDQSINLETDHVQRKFWFHIYYSMMSRHQLLRIEIIAHESVNRIFIRSASFSRGKWCCKSLKQYVPNIMFLGGKMAQDYRI